MTQLIFGIHAVQAILKTQPERLIDISIQQGRQDDRVRAISNDAHALDIPLNTRSKQDLDKLCSGEAHGANHQGVVAQCKDIKPLDEQFLLHMLENLKEPALLLILDGVTDPHNLGACLRSAEAAGVHAVICPRDKSATLNPTVRKVACGAADIVPFVTVTNLARTLRQIQELGIWVIGAAGEATQSLYATDLTGAVALVLGAEGEGMRRLTREHCDIIANIPMAGEVSSLNVSVASGVCLFEAVRQRAARVAK